MKNSIKRKLMAVTLAVSMVMLSACTSENAESVDSRTSSDYMESSEVESITEENSEAETSMPEMESSVPETTTSTETSAPETTTTEQTEAPVETPAPETTTKLPETDVPEITTTIQTEAPAPQWDETPCDKTMYINTSCYARKEAVMGAETVKLYNLNDEVKIVATTDTGYCKLEDGSFIHQDYLGSEKIEIPQIPQGSRSEVIKNYIKDYFGDLHYDGTNRSDIFLELGAFCELIQTTCTYVDDGTKTTAYDLIVYKEGNCVAGADLIKYACGYLGVDACKTIPGTINAYSAPLPIYYTGYHVSTFVHIDGKYRIVEATPHSIAGVYSFGGTKDYYQNEIKTGPFTDENLNLDFFNSNYNLLSEYVCAKTCDGDWSNSYEALG